MRPPVKKLNLLMVLLVAFLSVAESGCYFFRKRKTGSAASGSDTPTVISRPIGAKAGSANDELLAALHAIETPHAPASVRPDPDMFVRRLLLQFRSPGATLAREIGRVEQYRMLLGGASEDFVKEASLTYDATSLLAKLKVAEEVCEGLVNPDQEQHPGWQSVLPATPTDPDTNLRYLTQRLLGVPSTEISEATLTSLREILDTGKVGGVYTHDSYIPVCATLLVDAQALLY